MNLAHEFQQVYDANDERGKSIMMSRADPFYFAWNHCVTFDERPGRGWKPYPKWDYLSDVIHDIRHGGNLYWLKSQRMLITITFSVELLWEWLYEEMNAIWIGKNERAADDGGANSTWNSALGKIRMMYDSLPPWLVEDALGRHYHSKYIFKFCNIVNPRTHSIIRGQAPTSNAGIGEGQTIAVVDEAAQIANLNVIHTNLARSCERNRHYISFPNGKDNKFAEVHFQEGHFGFECREVHWRLRPDYNDEWYDDQKKLGTKFEIAQRLDMSFEESVAGKVWPAFNYRDNVKDVRRVPELPIYMFWDYGFEDATSIGFVQYDPAYKQTVFKCSGKDCLKRWRAQPVCPDCGSPGLLTMAEGQLRIFDWLEQNHSNYIEISAALRVVMKSHGIESAPEFSKRIQGIGDPQGSHRQIDMGLSLQDRYAEEGFSIMVAGAHETIAVLGTIDEWLANAQIIIDFRCEPIIDSMQYWEWPMGGDGRKKVGATQPVHNRFSHAGKALEYGAVELIMGGMVDLAKIYPDTDVIDPPLGRGILHRKF